MWAGHGGGEGGAGQFVHMNNTLHRSIVFRPTLTLSPTKYHQDVEPVAGRCQRRGFQHPPHAASLHRDRVDAGDGSGVALTGGEDSVGQSLAVTGVHSGGAGQGVHFWEAHVSVSALLAMDGEYEKAASSRAH